MEMMLHCFDIRSAFVGFDFEAFNESLVRVFRNDPLWEELNEKGYRFSVFVKICTIERYFGLDTGDLFLSLADRKSFLAFLNVDNADDLPDIRQFVYFKGKVASNNWIYSFWYQLDRVLAKRGMLIHRGRVRGPRISFTDEGQAHSLVEDNGNLISEIYYPGITYPIIFRSNTSDLDVFKEVILDRTYDLSLDIEPEFIVDCGANIGLSTIFFKNMFPDSFIVAIEPEISNFALAEHNLSYYYPSTECLRSAVWHKNDRVVIKDNGGEKWGFKVDECGVDEEGSIETITVGQIMRNYHRESIDILKIDIEGAELELFSDNFEEWLPNSKVIIIELHDHLKRGCSRSFFSALSRYDFSIKKRGDIWFCIRQKQDICRSR